MMRRIAISTALAGTGLALVLAVGCYRHVVKQSGPGPERDIYEPNVSDEERNAPRIDVDGDEAAAEPGG